MIGRNIFNKLCVIIFRCLSLITGFAFAFLFFSYFRYLPPLAAKKIDQDINKSIIERETGLLLSPDTKILVASDDDFRDGTKQFFYWDIFSNKPIRLPSRKSARAFDPGLLESVRVIEADIAPYKIKNPVSVWYQSWDHGETNTRATIVAGKNGYYMSLEIFRYK